MEAYFLEEDSVVKYNDQEYTGEISLNISIKYMDEIAYYFDKELIKQEDIVATDKEHVIKIIENLIDEVKNILINKKIVNNCYGSYSLQENQFIYTKDNLYNKIQLIIKGPIKFMKSLKSYCVQKNEETKNTKLKIQKDNTIKKYKTFLEKEVYSVN
jgi:hypothetical protein